ncbi:MAG: methyltransferase domain-containing protein [Polyangiaceae bacterium]
MTRVEQEARVQATFDTVASGYDHPMLSWFGSTAKVVAQASGLVDGEQALDLATGTGKVALALAAQAPGAEVLGLDLSSGMLSEARSKAAAAGASSGTGPWLMLVDKPKHREHAARSRRVDRVRKSEASSHAPRIGRRSRRGERKRPGFDGFVTGKQRSTLQLKSTYRCANLSPRRSAYR